MPIHCSKFQQDLILSHPQPQTTHCVNISNNRLNVFHLTTKTIFQLRYPNLTHLTLNSCDIRNLRGFPQLRKLIYLDLSQNQLQGTFHHLIKLRKLCHLNVSHNIVRDIVQFRAIVPLIRRQKTFELFLNGNPCYKGASTKLAGKKMGFQILATGQSSMYISSPKKQAGEEKEDSNQCRNIVKITDKSMVGNNNGKNNSLSSGNSLNNNKIMANNSNSIGSAQIKYQVPNNNLYRRNSKDPLRNPSNSNNPSNMLHKTNISNTNNNILESCITPIEPVLLAKNNSNTMSLVNKIPSNQLPQIQDPFQMSFVRGSMRNNKRISLMSHLNSIDSSNGSGNNKNRGQSQSQIQRASGSAMQTRIDILNKNMRSITNNMTQSPKPQHFSRAQLLDEDSSFLNMNVLNNNQQQLKYQLQINSQLQMQLDESYPIQIKTLHNTLETHPRIMSALQSSSNSNSNLVTNNNSIVNNTNTSNNTNNNTNNTNNNNSTVNTNNNTVNTSNSTVNNNNSTVNNNNSNINNSQQINNNRMMTFINAIELPIGRQRYEEWSISEDHIQRLYGDSESDSDS